MKSSPGPEEKNTGEADKTCFSWAEVGPQLLGGTHTKKCVIWINQTL